MIDIIERDLHRYLQDEDTKAALREATEQAIEEKLAADFFQNNASEILVDAIGCDALDAIDNTLIKALKLGGNYLDISLRDLLATVDDSELDGLLQIYSAT